MEQSLYWKELFQLKVHNELVELFVKRSERIDRCLNMFIAIASSASIGAWAVWKEFAFIWAIIIALSQIVHAIRAYLPFQERLKLLTQLRNSYSELFIYSDTRWPEVASGGLNNADISKIRSEIRSRKLEFEKKAFPNSSLPEDDALFEKASLSAERYFKNFYGVTA